MSNPLRGKANNTGYSTEVPEVGPHTAVLVAMIDKGTHTEEFKDQKTGKAKLSDVRKFLLVWELTDAVLSGTTNNHLVWAVYSISYQKKGKLRLLAESIRGKAYGDDEPIEYDRMLGMTCLVSIKHKVSQAGNTYAVVDTVTRPMKGQAVPPAKRKPVLWFLNDDDLGHVSYDLIPDWIPFRESLLAEIQGSHQIAGKPGRATGPTPQPAGSLAGHGTDPGMYQGDDEIPF